MGKNRLLPRMRAKIWSSGKTYYYYDTCSKPRKWLPLGPNYLDALQLYADYEREYNQDDLECRINGVITFKFVAERYVKEVVPSKAPSTQQCNLRSLKHLLSFFDDPPAPLNSIMPNHIRDYMNYRSAAKVRANRERALFSHMFNKAREWGYTDRENPCHGVRGNTENGRDVYITDSLFWKVYDQADKHIQAAMMLAYLTGQRVADVLKIKVADIIDGCFWIKQNKTQTKLRISIVGQLADLVEMLHQEREIQAAKHEYLVSHRGGVVTYEVLRYGMDKARRLANVDKADFQFRDLRAKAATDKEESGSLDDAKNLLGHKNASMTNEYVRNRLGKLVEPTVLAMENKPVN